MRVLVIGSGGREHALCWAIAASPLLTKLWCAPGNPGIAQVAECVAIGALDIRGARRVRAGQRDRPGGAWPGGAAGRWHHRCDGGRRHPLHRSVARRRATRRQQGVHQGIVRRGRHSDGPVGALRRCGGGARIRPPPRRADRGEGGRPGGRQGRRGGGDRSRGAGGDRRDDAGARVRRGGRLGGDRGMPGRARKSRCSRCATARRRCRSASAQDHKRVGEGDTGPNTGGMGSYSPTPAFSPALQDAAMDGIIRPALAEMARRGTPFRGILYAGLMLTADGREADRVQRAVRRSGMSGAGAADEVGPAAGVAGGVRWRTGEFRSALARRSASLPW